VVEVSGGRDGLGRGGTNLRPQTPRRGAVIESDVITYQLFVRINSLCLPAEEVLSEFLCDSKLYQVSYTQFSGIASCKGIGSILTVSFT
jgi:hypothetical protein